MFDTVKALKIILISLFALSSLSFFGQVTKSKVQSRNSGYDYIQKNPKHVNVEKNLEKANKILSKDPQTAITLVQEALVSAKFEADTLGEARCYALLGKINSQNNQPSLAERNYQKSSALYKVLGLNENYLQTKLLQAKNQLKNNKILEAKANADTLILLSKNNAILADAHEIVGEIYYQKKEYAIMRYNH